MDIENDATYVATADNHVVGNLVENIDYNAEGYGFGILIANNAYAEISGNTLVNVAIGITPQNYSQSNPAICRIKPSNPILSVPV